MNKEQEQARWARVQALFASAAALPVGEREAWLKRHADDDMRDELRRLLQHDDDAGDRAAADPVESVLTDAAAGWLQGRADRLVGSRLGAWRIQRHLADGGMGAVYLAARADGQFEQRAAIKLLNPALVSAASHARLAAERQILARLQHRHIAGLIDGGNTLDGAPYLVMEFVDGLAIDRYVETHGLDGDARLRLMLQVCDAVEHAHRNLVVHRDLKPSNILVDTDGLPKLLDFGVARLLDDAGEVTRADQRLLTPTYASPEQLRGEPVTTATDVYALGVLLYRLLAGRPPFPVDPDKPSSGALLAREILETEPRRPSQAQPSAGPRRALAGELDLIVLKAMHKDPQRRYPSARALAEDLHNHLRHLPVSAHADSIAYRMAKFVRRHRIAVPATALSLAAAAAAGVAFTVSLDAQRAKAEAAAARAERVADFMTGAFTVADPRVNLGETVTARELLDNAARQIAIDLRDEPGTQAALRGTIGSAFLGLGLYEPAQAQLAQALDQATQVFGANSIEALQARSRLGDALHKLGRYDEAVVQLRQALAALRAHPPSTLQVKASIWLGEALWRQGREHEQAQQALQDAVELAARLGPTGDAERAQAMVTLSDFLRFRGRYHEALDWARQSLALNRQLHGEQHPGTVESLRALASIHMRRDETAQALDFNQQALDATRRIYGDDHLRTAYVRANLGHVHYQLGDHARAEAMAREALVTFEQRLGAEHPRTAFLIENLANAVLEQGRHDEALAMYRQSLDKLRRTFGADHVEVGYSTANVAGAFERMKRFDEMVPLMQEANRVLQGALGADAPQVAKGLARLAHAQIELGRYDAAEATLAQAQRTADAGLPAQHSIRTFVLEFQGLLALRRGRPAQAEPWLRQALAMQRELRMDRGAKLAATEQLLAECLLALKQPREAAALLRSAVSRLTDALGAEHTSTRAAARELQRVQRGAMPGG